MAEPRVTQQPRSPSHLQVDETSLQRQLVLLAGGTQPARGDRLATSSVFIWQSGHSMLALAAPEAMSGVGICCPRTAHSTALRWNWCSPCMQELCQYSLSRDQVVGAFVALQVLLSHMEVLLHPGLELLLFPPCGFPVSPGRGFKRSHCKAQGCS